MSDTPRFSEYPLPQAIQAAAVRLEQAVDASLFEGRSETWQEAKERILDGVRSHLHNRRPTDVPLVIDEVFMTQEAVNVALALLYQTELHILQRAWAANPAPVYRHLGRTHRQSAAQRYSKSSKARQRLAYLSAAIRDALDDFLIRAAPRSYRREHSANIATYVATICSSTERSDLAKRHALSALAWKAADTLPPHQKRFLYSLAAMIEQIRHLHDSRTSLPKSPQSSLIDPQGLPQPHESADLQFPIHSKRSIEVANAAAAVLTISKQLNDDVILHDPPASACELLAGCGST